MQKMSKSLGNNVGIFDAPNEMFGKIMSISDDLMWRWFDLLSMRPLSEIETLKEEAAKGRNPRDIKFELARELITRFHSEAEALEAQNAFEKRFAKNEIPEDLETIRLKSSEPMPIAQVLKQAGLCQSTSEALRHIQAGAVKLEGEKVEDKALCLEKGFVGVLQVGKRKMIRVEMA